MLGKVCRGQTKIYGEIGRRDNRNLYRKNQLAWRTLSGKVVNKRPLSKEAATIRTLNSHITAHSHARVVF